ncbi:MAG: replication factor C large subunit [Candidatus ainarchaeum sp.]|nr:replication factor C large subunit [Candidatus ainarchaeum sp.]
MILLSLILEFIHFLIFSNHHHVMDATLFTDKYSPSKFEEFIGNVEIVDRVIEWANAWKEGKKQKPILLFGNPGTGKTALALMVAKEFNWQLFEMNSSDLRDKESIEKIVGAAISNSSLFSSKRLILLDEVDAISSRDRGGSSAILSVLKEANNPIILTANDAFDKKLSSIRPTCEVLEFKKINYLSIAKRLREICSLEGIEFDEEAIKEIAKNSAGDFRSALLDIQSLSPKITLDSVKALSFRERKEKIFPVMSKIFKGKSISEIKEAVDSVDVSIDLMNLWIEENIPKQFDFIDTANAFNIFSKADIFNGRIMNRQHWGFLKYSIFLSTCGVGLSRRKDYNFFQPLSFPTLLSSLSKSSSLREIRKSIALKIGEKIHCSKNQVLQDFYYFKTLFEIEKNTVGYIQNFGFEDKEVAFLLGLKEKDKRVLGLIKESKEYGKRIVIEKLNGKQATLFS